MILAFAHPCLVVDDVEFAIFPFMSTTAGLSTSVAESFTAASDALGGKLDIVVLNAGVGDVGPALWPYRHLA